MLQPEIPEAVQPPNCPLCGAVMIVRRNRLNHGSFWGCLQWPMCTGTRRPWDTGSGERRAGGKGR